MGLTGGDHQMHVWWQVFNQKGESIVNRFGINQVVVVKDEDEIIRDGGDFELEQGGQNGFRSAAVGGIGAQPAALRQFPPGSSATLLLGKKMNRAGSLSPLSSDSHATGIPQLAIHSLTSVVLPKPAGAEMRVSLPTNPSIHRSIRRGRRTILGRDGGI